MNTNFNDYTNIFFWDENRKNNVNYNFQILSALFKSKNSSDNIIFNKPIIIFSISIIECILYDFGRRLNEYKKEIIPGIDKNTIDDSPKIGDLLYDIIEFLKGKDYLKSSLDNEIYEKLHHLREIRNRIHIQNSQNKMHVNEIDLWTEDEIGKCIYMFETIIEILCNSHPRPDRPLLPMINFPRPWKKRSFKSYITGRWIRLLLI